MTRTQTHKIPLCYAIAMSKYRLRVCSQAKEIAAHSSLCFVFGLDKMFDIKLKECCLLFMQIFRETCSKGKASKAQKKGKNKRKLEHFVYISLADGLYSDIYTQ